MTEVVLLLSGFQTKNSTRVDSCAYNSRQTTNFPGMPEKKRLLRPLKQQQPNGTIEVPANNRETKCCLLRTYTQTHTYTHRFCRLPRSYSLCFYYSQLLPALWFLRWNRWWLRVSPKRLKWYFYKRTGRMKERYATVTFISRVTGLFFQQNSFRYGGNPSL